MIDRVLAWFSRGTPSLVNAKLTIDRYGDDAEVIYCDSSAEEHPDNLRYHKEAELWLGRTIKIVSSVYKSPTEIFAKRRYMSGVAGAPCTVELKKVPRFEYQTIDDIHSWGYHIGEEKRIALFEKNNPELKNIYPLVEAGYTKADCKAIIHNAGIEEPMMYRLGFDHNNCIGCVKAGSPKYWNKIRQHFPVQFAARAEQSRDIGCRLVKINDDERIYLDELSPNNNTDLFEDISCGPQCTPS